MRMIIPTAKSTRSFQEKKAMDRLVKDGLRVATSIVADIREAASSGASQTTIAFNMKSIKHVHAAAVVLRSKGYKVDVIPSELTVRW